MAENTYVLARKYRPQVFADLIGQDALVRTITNAIANNRLAHAYMLTGIRGVGKTTSARIIAKGLNCIGPDGQGQMTPNPCGQCQHCIDIMNDAHMDIIEIDAASNTGVDNVREIIDGAKYNPVSARYKIYIIDEVHMLSKQAFNALLKTLEEPPERIKFIFATTEIRKVPVTILSRCQRFDLRRIDQEMLANHLSQIAEKEKVTFEPSAIQLIAHAGDGSVRDALSLLDQGITQLNANLTLNNVRQMLGIVDRGHLLDLFESIMRGDMVSALDLLGTQYECGADPLMVAQDLLELTHHLTRVKIVPDLGNDPSIPQAERARGQEIAIALSMASLTSAWQMLLKGLQEIKGADSPFRALEMLLIRLAYLSDLPSPAQVIEDIKKNTNVTTTSTPTTTNQHPPVHTPATSQPVASPAFSNIQEMAQFIKSKGERLLAFNVEQFVRPIHIVGSNLTCSFESDAPRTLSGDLCQFLTRETGTQWTLDVKMSGGNKTAREIQQDQQKQLMDNIKKVPLVAESLTLFKGAKIDKITPLKPVEEPPAQDESDDSV